MNFMAYYGNDNMIIYYLKETSDPLNFVDYSPYINIEGRVTGGYI